MALMERLDRGRLLLSLEGNNIKTPEVAGESTQTIENLLDRCRKDGQDTTL
jgi:hypothetical protein